MEETSKAQVTADAVLKLVCSRDRAGLCRLGPAGFDAKAVCGFTPLSMACYIQWRFGVEHLLESGASPNMAAPVDAAVLGWLDLRDEAVRGKLRRRKATVCAEIVSMLASQGGQLQDSQLSIPEGWCRSEILSKL